MPFQPFRQLFLETPHLRQKVVARKGDIVEVNLGLGQADLDSLCEEVVVVIHAAACVRFDLTLQAAMETNVQGLKNLLQLATKMKNLKVEWA